MPRLASVVLLAGLAACGETAAPGTDAPSGRDVHVVAAFYPLEFLATRVGGDRVAVTNLTPPGVEPHDLDLAPADAASLADADLVFLLGGGFQHVVEEAVAEAGTTAVDLLPAETTDPHVWLDPPQMRVLAERVAEALGGVDPDRQATYAGNLAELHMELDELDAEYAAGLEPCRIRALTVSHAAFGHVAARYGFEQIAIAGIDPEAEPAPADLERAVEQARAAGVTTVYAETLIEADLAETVAAELGAVVTVLDPLEGIAAEDLEAGADYFTVMRANLATLVAGQHCA